MENRFKIPEYEILRDVERCDQCHLCERQCVNGVHFYDEHKQRFFTDPQRCVNC